MKGKAKKGVLSKFHRFHFHCFLFNISIIFIFKAEVASELKSP